MKIERDAFEAAVRQALDSIPPPFQRYLEGIEFVVARRSPEGIFGRYEGSGALDEDRALPARVTLFQDAHESNCQTWEELVEEIRRTVLHEVGHHFLMEEDELPF